MLVRFAEMEGAIDTQKVADHLLEMVRHGRSVGAALTIMRERTHPEWFKRPTTCPK
jgi:hypothetical protein